MAGNYVTRGALALLLGAASSTCRASPDNLCKVLTHGEVVAVLGLAASADTRGGAAYCEWTAGGTSRPRKIKVSLQDLQSFAGAKEDVGHGIVKTPAPGIGDDAVFVLTPKFAVSLAVRRGNTVVFVDITGFPLEVEADVRDVEAREKELALRILPRL